MSEQTLDESIDLDELIDEVRISLIEYARYEYQKTSDEHRKIIDSIVDFPKLLQEMESLMKERDYYRDKLEEMK